MATKICSKCKIEKSLDQFRRGEVRPYWLTSQCKDCMNRHCRKAYRNQTKEQREQAKNRSKEYRLRLAEKRHRDLNIRLKTTLRSKFYATIKGHYKSNTLFNLLGCNISDLITHLESLFKPRMNWTNYGNGWKGRGMKEWHIDHIKPCASFDLTNKEELGKCFHYTNLQPLWAKENWSKSDK